MEVNKEEAARCRDIGADALRKNQFARAVKFLTKSLQLYPLPGVKPLLDQAQRKLNSETTGDEPSNHSTNHTHGTADHAPSRSTSTASNNTDSNGRSYTAAQAEIVTSILKAKQSGRHAHYNVLGLEPSADEAAIKKAYRKLALKLHPDKNSAPHADEAFKAVGLAYATLSDAQKRTIYDRYGDEDPDNRGGGGGRRAGNAHFHGQEVSPEDIFNMFFGGGMPGGAGGFGGPGVRVYSSGFGPGFAFGGMNPNMARQQQRQRQQQQDPGFLNQLVQFLPLLMILLLSFFNMPGENATGVGGSKYFSLTKTNAFTNPLSTKLSGVKDIPYFVSDHFLRTIYRDRYQLSQVERMVERSYERYLTEECKNQKDYKRKLENMSTNNRLPEEDRVKLTKKLAGFDLTRCVELEDLFPQSVPEQNRINRRSEL